MSEFDKSKIISPPHPYLGDFDLVAARREAVVRLAYFTLAANPKDRLAKKIVAQADNNHPLSEALVTGLLWRNRISEFYADLPTTKGVMRTTPVTISIATSGEEVISFKSSAHIFRVDHVN